MRIEKRFIKGERLISELEGEIKQLRRQMELLKLERRTLEEDRRDTSKAQAKFELNVKTLTDGLSGFGAGTNLAISRN